MKNNKNTKRQKNERRKKISGHSSFLSCFLFYLVFFILFFFRFFSFTSLFFFRSPLSVLYFLSQSIFFNLFYDILSGLSHFLFLSRALYVFRMSSVFINFPAHPFPLFLKGYRYSLFFSPKLSAVNLFPPLFSRFLQFVTRYSRGFFSFCFLTQTFFSLLFTSVYGSVFLHAYAASKVLRLKTF